LLNCRTSGSDISGYHKEFLEGHTTVREWQGRDMAWQEIGMGELAYMNISHRIRACSQLPAACLNSFKKVVKNYTCRAQHGE
jgi:hypothetical protein